jgi:hypothetical protein
MENEREKNQCGISILKTLRKSKELTAILMKAKVQ